MQRLRIALHIAYHGQDFDGWQDNFTNKSIEGNLKGAFYALFGMEVKLDAASRTDKGVHALSQLVILDIDDPRIPLDRWPSALNSKLPKTIRVKKAFIATNDFHPSLCAKEKTYLYQLNLKKVALPFEHSFYWHHPKPLNLSLMKEASQILIGTKDFSGFSNATKKESINPICSLYSLEFIDLGNLCLGIEITGDRFLYKMCRILVGTLVAVGRGQLSIKEVEGIFTRKNRLDAGITAPAHGLFLKSLNYPSFGIIT